MIDINTIEPTEIMKGFKGRFIHTEKLTLAYWEIEKGSILPLHSHHHEQITRVTEGQFELTIDGITKLCEEGEIAVIPPNVEHSGVAISDCKVFDIFTPVREDYKAQ